ncbi:MAG: hypothetical protein U0166_15805 [Acidobacteriota bacterium]
MLPGAAYLAAEDVPQPAPGDELVITTVPDGKEVGRFKVGRDGRGVAEIAFPRRGSGAGGRAARWSAAGGRARIQRPASIRSAVLAAATDASAIDASRSAPASWSPAAAAKPIAAVPG